MGRRVMTGPACPRCGTADLEHWITGTMSTGPIDHAQCGTCGHELTADETLDAYPGEQTQPYYDCAGQRTDDQ